MSLHDEHLQTALRHAPDQDLAPSQHVRESVLNYANNAAKPTPENWLKRSLNAFTTLHLKNWHVKTWQVAGMGALASMLLVIVMVREQAPDEPVWAESNIKSIAQAEVAQSKAEAPVANAPEAYQVAPKVEAPDVPMREVAKAKRSLASQEPPAKELAETTKIAAAPALSKTAEMADAAEAVQAPEAIVVATAPKPTPPIEVEAKQSLTKARQATIGAVNEAPISEAPMSQALNIDALLKQGGEATAKQDIAAGNLQILKIEKEACEKPNKFAAHDVDTNYKVLVICDSDDKARNELSQREVNAYNQTMRNWHQTYQN